MYKQPYTNNFLSISSYYILLSSQMPNEIGNINIPH